MIVSATHLWGDLVKIGIGLPNPVYAYREFPSTRLVEWARRAEDRGFHGLATIDRLAYGNYDSLVTLAAAAGATSRIGLVSNILLGRCRSSSAAPGRPRCGGR
jgi:alkanesulfonate monooxygenase SsuD/methylene tetrahydromethanopterin reductase-like flavin-dependent oxidoreductase (luciferase family)